MIYAGVSNIPVTADIAFLIDGSRYVGRRNFHLEKTFIKSIAGRFTIGKYQSHIGVATYGNRPHLRMRFNQYSSLGLVLRALNYIRFPNQVSRRVDLGLQASLRYFFSRRNMYSFVRKILVVVVSGRQTGRSSYVMNRLPSLFRRQGVLVFIVGVGRVDQRYLRPLTYRNKHVYVVRSYRSLVARSGSIARAIHQEMVCNRKSQTIMREPHNRKLFESCTANTIKQRVFKVLVFPPTFFFFFLRDFFDELKTK